MADRYYKRSDMTHIWIIMGINLILFIVTSIAPNVLEYLGLIPFIIADRPWSIITSIFVHGGIWHILANMFTLFFFGRYINTLLGRRKFLIVYFVGGILGNLLYLLIALYTPFGESISIVVGASGAVFAMGGVLAVMRPKIRVIIFPIPVPIPLWFAVIGGFLIISVFPGIAWQAHLGGLAWGLAIGYFFKKRERTYYYR
jgi:membrane associated rhomboid family serine protease